MDMMTSQTRALEASPSKIDCILNADSLAELSVYHDDFDTADKLLVGRVSFEL